MNILDKLVRRVIGLHRSFAVNDARKSIDAYIESIQIKPNHSQKNTLLLHKDSSFITMALSSSNCFTEISKNSIKIEGNTMKEVVEPSFNSFFIGTFK